jgi:FkbM family methyltransferase
MKKILSFIKKFVVTRFGARGTFPLKLADVKLKVDYNLRSIEAERDYDIILQLASGKKCIFDIGANHGVISFLIRAQNEYVAVHAFEASEDAVRIINHNSHLNGYTSSIRVINSLIADKSGYAIPFYGEGSAGGASITQGRLGHRTEVYKSTLSIDDYVSHFKLKPEFIKMDIEGAENIAIKGMKETLRNHRPEVFIELHEFGPKKLYENAKDILNFISTLGYVMIYLRDGKKITDSEVLKNRGRCHVLVMPEEKYSHEFIASLNLNGL